MSDYFSIDDMSAADMKAILSADLEQLDDDQVLAIKDFVIRVGGLRSADGRGNAAATRGRGLIDVDDLGGQTLAAAQSGQNFDRLLRGLHADLVRQLLGGQQVLSKFPFPPELPWRQIGRWLPPLLPALRARLCSD